VKIRSPERAKRNSTGRSAVSKCVKCKPCKGVRIVRVALSGLISLSYVNAGRCPVLLRDALSGLRLQKHGVLL